MGKDLENLPAQELQTTYLKIKEFISYLDKEYKDIEKTREDNE